MKKSRWDIFEKHFKGGMRVELFLHIMCWCVVLIAEILAGMLIQERRNSRNLDKMVSGTVYISGEDLYVDLDKTLEEIGEHKAVVFKVVAQK